MFKKKAKAIFISQKNIMCVFYLFIGTWFFFVSLGVVHFILESPAFPDGGIPRTVVKENIYQKQNRFAKENI